MEVTVLGLHINLLKIINPAFYILFIVVLYLVTRRVLKIGFERAIRGKKIDEHQKQKIQTIHEMIRSVLWYVTMILVFLVLLAAFGVNVTSLVAGLGVLTAILGLAFQDMIKDMIAGMSFITEGQFSVGDMISVNGFKGTVISLGLKTTQIQNYRGEVNIVSNRDIDNLINYSKTNVISEVKIEVPVDMSVDKVMKALNEVKKQLDGKMKLATGEIIISPLSDLDETGATYTLACASLPGDASDIQADIRKAIIEEFKKEKIDFGSPRVVVKGKK